jgi:hypothetical protein
MEEQALVTALNKRKKISAGRAARLFAIHAISGAHGAPYSSETNYHRYSKVADSVCQSSLLASSAL